MIRIEMVGMCEGCVCAELELGWRAYEKHKEWFITCKHRDACDWMETKTINRIKADTRDCEHCTHHTEQGCTKWECEFERREE